MNASGRRPSCQRAEVHVSGSVGAGDRARTVGDGYTDAFRVLAPFGARSRLACEYAEVDRTSG